MPTELPDVEKLDAIVDWMQRRRVYSIELKDLAISIEIPSRDPAPLRDDDEKPPPVVALTAEQASLARKNAQFLDLFGREMTDEEARLYKDVPSFITG